MLVSAKKTPRQPRPGAPQPVFSTVRHNFKTCGAVRAVARQWLVVGPKTRRELGRRIGKLTKRTKQYTRSTRVTCVLDSNCDVSRLTKERRPQNPPKRNGVRRAKSVILSHLQGAHPHASTTSISCSPASGAPLFVRGMVEKNAAPKKWAATSPRFGARRSPESEVPAAKRCSWQVGVWFSQLNLSSSLLLEKKQKRFQQKGQVDHGRLGHRPSRKGVMNPNGIGPVI